MNWSGSSPPGRQVKVRASGKKEFNALVRIDTPQEAQYYANGGILQFVLRQLIASKPAPVHADSICRRELSASLPSCVRDVRAHHA